MRRQLLSWLLPSALLILVAFSACAYWIARAALLSEASRSVSALTVAAAARVEAFFAQRESDLLAAAESPLLRDHYLNAEFRLREESREALSAVRDMLGRLSARTGVYPRLFYLDAEGRELCRVGPPGEVHERLVERLRLSAPGEVVVVDADGDGVVHYAVAVRDEKGRRRGAVVLDTSLASVEAFLAALNLGPSGRARLAPRRGEGSAPDLSGAKIRHSARVGATPWDLEVEADRAQFLAGLDRLRGATLFFLVVAALLLVVGIWRQTAVLLRPLSRLEAAARRYAEGGFEVQLAREGPREVQTVASAFNMMAARLGERTRDLQARVRELTALQGLSEWALSGRSEVTEACLEAAVAGLGFTRGALYLIDEDKRQIVGECVYGTESSGLSRVVMKKRRISMDAHDILAHVYRTRRPVSVEDPSKDSRCDPAFVAEANTKGFAMAPVLAGEKVLAIIGVDYGSEPRRLDEASFMSLSMFCAAAGVVLDHARLLSELKASEARYRGSVEYSPAAVVDLDSEQRITLWNRAARELFGFSEKEALGTTLDLVGIGVKAGRYESKAKTKDGKALDVSVSCTGSEKEWFVVIQDETQKKELREQLLHAEKLSAAGTLLGEVAHELNNPLHAVAANAEFALESLGEEEHKEDLREVIRHARRCSDIVAGLLRFVRQDTNTRARVSLNAVVEETVLLMNYRVEKKEFASLVLTLDGGGPAVAGDFKQLQQVLVNLIGNACDAVSGRPDPREVRVGTDMVGGVVRVWVEDTGPGVPEGLRKKIFEPFYTTKGPGHGTGLGLAISSQIVRDMGGTLVCEDAPVGGARFVASFPPCPAGVEEVKRPSTDMPAACPGKRVLLVDDDPGVAHAMERLAREDGLLTAVESGVERAKERLLKEDFDLVVSDVEMDGRRGLELLGLRKGGRPRFVFVTGDTLNSALRREVEGLGAPLLAKPFMRVDFLREVRKGLGNLGGV